MDRIYIPKLKDLRGLVSLMLITGLKRGPGERYRDCHICHSLIQEMKNQKKLKDHSDF